MTLIPRCLQQLDCETILSKRVGWRKRRDDKRRKEKTQTADSLAPEPCSLWFCCIFKPFIYYIVSIKTKKKMKEEEECQRGEKGQGRVPKGVKADVPHEAFILTCSDLFPLLLVLSLGQAILMLGHILFQNVNAFFDQ